MTFYGVERTHDAAAVLLVVLTITGIIVWWSRARRKARKRVDKIHRKLPR